MLASVLHLCCPCFVIFSHFISQSFFRYLPYEPSFVLFLLSIITSSVHSFRLAIVCSVSVWNLFRLRHVQASSSSRLTFHFTGSSIMYYDHKRWMKKDRCTWKSHCLLVPQNVTCYRFQCYMNLNLNWHNMSSRFPWFDLCHMNFLYWLL